MGVSYYFRNFASVMEMNDNTRDFIRRHLTDDVRQLALLSAGQEDVDVAFALRQIQGWQTARAKLPSWAEREGVVYPPHLNMEQCSSEETACYKQRLVARLCPDGGTMADLTGGFGVDFSFLSRAFSRAIYVERNDELCRLMGHNRRALGLANAEIRCADCASALEELPPLDLIFMDPARRDGHGGKVSALRDCQPDVLSLRDTLLRKARVLLLKLSPMLDWHEAVRQLDCVREVHVVSVGNECKELLLVCSAGQVGEGCVCCANGSQMMAFPMAADPMEGLRMATRVAEGDYLYEPNASVMKAGCFGRVCSDYGVGALAHDSHLFVSSSLVSHFPGRRFRIRAVSTLNKRELRQKLAGLTRANVSVRNFPLTVAELRKRLKLCDGGDVYLFGTTFQPPGESRPSHLLLVTEKA